MHCDTIEGAMAVGVGLIFVFILAGYLFRNKVKMSEYLMFLGGAMILLGFLFAPLTHGLSILGFMFGWPVGFIGACSITFKRLAL
jgi:hypothetical protein